MRFGSLFSGVGGLDLGLERAGMTCAWQVEIDPYCRRVLDKHWPDVPKFGDVKELTGDELPPVDLICGGFPCQPVSRAGRRLAQADERWLWPEFARIVRVLRPRYVLVENVPGLLAHGLSDVLGDLAGLGFDAEWESIPAAAFGAPHLRDRVFLVAWAEHGRALAYAGGGRGSGHELRAGRDEPGVRRAPVAYPDRSSTGKRHGRRDHEEAPPKSARASAAVADPDSFTVVRAPISREERHPWSVEPAVGRVVDGVPSRVDRLRGLGNAVVPQVAEWIGRRLMLANRRSQA
jgi:DNA (cytosine-5)-methyltransferase 1